MKKERIEVELNNTLNHFEEVLLSMYDRLSMAERFKLRAEYVDLKYDIIKFILRVNSPLKGEDFSFDDFQDLAKLSSPMLKHDKPMPTVGKLTKEGKL